MLVILTAALLTRFCTCDWGEMVSTVDSSVRFKSTWSGILAGASVLAGGGGAHAVDNKNIVRKILSIFIYCFPIQGYSIT